MKKRKGKLKIFTCLLSLMMIGTLLPTAAFAEGEEGAEIRMESGVAALTVNNSKVAFAGHEWWVIGVDASGDDTNENGEGVYPQDGSITLLAANNDEEFGNTAFREGSYTPLENYQQYYGSGYYYAKNPDGIMAWETPNEYAGSTLQQKMEKIASEFQMSFSKECAFINGRDLTKNDEIAGQEGINNQKLWALSEEEFKAIRDTGVASFANSWWLRSAFEDIGDMSLAVYSSGNNVDCGRVSMNYVAVRPALSLNLSSVLFTSDAIGGKSPAFAAGNELIKTSKLSTDSGAVKFTMKDKSQKLTVNATDAQSKQTGEELTFTYSEATTGDNQYISCILTDSNGAVAYYGKLKEISNSNNESGAITIPLKNVDSGTYTLKIFSEEINGSLCTDFCSDPVTMTVEVDEGQGTVSDFRGTIIHEHSWADAWNYDENYHWHECEAAKCDITDNSDKYQYGMHVYDQYIAYDDYLAKAATCESPAKYYYSCICGKSGTKTFTYGAPTGHDWGDPEWAWSEDYSGATATFICQNDSNHVETPDVTVTSKIIKEATCTMEGEKTYIATVTFNSKDYTDTKTEVISATGHTFGEWITVKSPNCTDKGSQQRTCSACGFTETKELDAKGHDWQADYTVDKEATCTEAGSKSIHCNNCDAVKDITVIPATGHKWSEPEWTWTEDYKSATATFTCKNDSNHKEYVTAKVESKTTTAATCTTEGEKTYTATGTFNNINYTDTKTETIAATGHTSDGGKITKEATHTVDGEKTYTCTVCGAEIKTEPIPALGHTFPEEWKSDADNHWHECECGEKADTVAHTFEWVIDKEATAQEPGSKHEECTVCGYARDAVAIPATGTGTPTDPTNPIDPTDPTDPTNPADPTDPTDPTNPADPTDPVDSTNPTNPVDPTEPTNPSDSTVPAEATEAGSTQNADANAQTGDEFNMGILLAVMALAGTAAAGTVVIRRRNG